MKSPDPKTKLTRLAFLQLLDAALASKSYRFSRQTCLAWLAVYPGDLRVLLYQARALADEGKTPQALAILDRLVMRDPLDPAVYLTLCDLTYGKDEARFTAAAASLTALGLDEGLPVSQSEIGKTLHQARIAMKSDDYSTAETLLHSLLGGETSALLTDLFHLELAAKSQDAQAVRALAEMYHIRYPECLPISLILADALMEAGSEPEAVRLLHQCMSMDASGQAAVRMWGENHPYRSLWPEALSIYFDMPVPAEVAAELGWNRLPGANVVAAVEPARESEPVVSQPVVVEPAPVVDDPVAPPAAETIQPVEMVNVDGSSEVETAPKGGLPPQDVQEMQAVEAEFEKLARKLKKPAIGRADGRFPVYVLFTTRQGLLAQYGPQTTSIIDLELRRLGEAVRKRTGWATLVYYPDDAACMQALGMPVMEGGDAWKLKLSLSDLDKTLAKKGQMIGMLAIVGGPQVVPFHELPNPTDDYDQKVYSDNPYATLDSNYFVPEWPVGRLPAEDGPDACLLLEEIRFLIGYHNRAQRMKTIPTSEMIRVVGNAIQSILRALSLQKDTPNFGYTAAVWRRSSTAVFRPVGNPAQMLISPPQAATHLDVDRVLGPQLSYYNLHGMEDAGEWYGQRDPSDPLPGPDYPVAITPNDLKRNGHAPRVIFSEACYGGNILHKKEDTALSLKFLSLGTQAIVASTGIAYGSVSTPLVAADLLGNYFWQQLRNGRTAGEAVMAAKIDLVREMVKRQGFLDAEDQKTLLSFVLYGDPLACLETAPAHSKGVIRLKKHASVRLVEEKLVEPTAPQPVSQEVIKQVKTVLAGYLPGMESADFHVLEQEAVRGSSASSKAVNGVGNHFVVSMSKQVPVAKQIHRHYARATVDEKGVVIKLVVSR